MSDLKERLRRLRAGCGFVQTPSDRERSTRETALPTSRMWDLYRRYRQESPHILAVPPTDLPTDIVGAEIETPYGVCFYREKWLLPTPFWPWDDLTTCAAVILGRADDPTCTGRLSEWLFLDVETTGLGGGVGVLPFLVGIGRVEDGMLRVRQFFLRTLEEEPAMLWALAEHITQSRGIVTYNGKTYDRHVLYNRMRLYHMELDIRTWPHIDMYHWVRALWRGIWPDVRLQTAEYQLWGWTRSVDLAGAEIPAAYRAYLRTGASEYIYRIFAHNLQDIQSLAGLTLTVARLLQQPQDAAAQPQILYRIGRRVMRSDWRWGVQLWETVLSADTVSARVRTGVVIHGLRVLRRYRAWDRIHRWLRLVDRHQIEALHPIAWARLAYYAYRYARDARRAIELLHRAIAHPDAHPTDRERWLRRQNWLERKRQPPLDVSDSAD